jgi:hypothetical protein
MDIKIGNWYYVKGCNQEGGVLYEGYAQAVRHTTNRDGAKFVRIGKDGSFVVYKNKAYGKYPFDEIKPASKLHRYLNGE